jgi:hypothetical protein
MFKSALFRASVFTPILPIARRHLLFVLSSTRRTINKIAPIPLDLGPLQELYGLTQSRDIYIQYP